EKLLKHVRTLGENALERLREMMTRRRLIGDVRGLGLLMAIELVKDRSTMERATDEAEQVMYRALNQGLNFKLTMGNILALTPALTATQAEMDRALEILDASISEVERQSRQRGNSP